VNFVKIFYCITTGGVQSALGGT